MRARNSQMCRLRARQRGAVLVTAMLLLLVLTIIVPVHNELATLRESVERCLRVPCAIDREFVIVDDGSTDGTSELLRARDWPA